jgi:hypothetical protein
MVPFALSDSRDALEVIGVHEVELDFVPKRAGVPTFKSDHVEQQAQFPSPLQEFGELGEKTLIFCPHELSPDVNDEELLAARLVVPDGHFRWS